VPRSVRELLASGERSFSFEFFPPKTDEGETQLWTAIRELEPLAPTFVSVTYGAGGSTRERTIRVVQRVATETSITAVAHLTCVAASVADLRAVVRDIQEADITNVLALRGDMPGDPGAPFEPHPEGLCHAEDLVRLLKESGEFCVGVAAYPEGHPDSPDLDTDVKYFAQKCAAGADFALTNFLFRASDYFTFVDKARAAGCETPIIPGVMPVTNVSQIERMALMSGAQFPPDLAERLRAVADDAEAVRAIGVDHASALCRELLDGGAPGLHFYTLNRSTATREVYQRLGLGPATPAA
jgi:methylenetetrahydrofolate reductase (NADPH)